MLTRVKGKGQIGARHVAWMRGAFNGQRLVVSGAGKPEARVGAVEGTRRHISAEKPVSKTAHEE
jgi:hypothetical protein